MDYWEECIAEAFEDAGISATAEQIVTVASWVEGAHENYGMARGYDVFSVNLRAEQNREIDRLKAAVIEEREKVPCQICRGKGRIISYGPSHSSDEHCWKCNGEGRHKP